MTRIFSIFIAFALLFSFAGVHAQDDCTTYLGGVIADFERLKSLQEASNMSNMEDVGLLLYNTYELRHKYEDLSSVPGCATELHPLIIRYFAVQEDVLALSMAWYSDVSHRSEYEVRLPQLFERLQSTASNINAELGSLDSTYSVQNGFPAGNNSSDNSVSTFTPTPKPSGSLDNPFPAGEWLSFDDVNIRATQLIRHANSEVANMNMFSDPPPAGSEYVLVYFEVECKQQTCSMFGSSGFRLIDSQGREWEEPNTTVVLEPDLDMLEAIEGGTMQGWQVFMFPPDETITAIYVRWGGDLLGGGDVLYTLPPSH